ncbi:MAG: exodeoxyribonuclease V subunit alpha [Magnetococcales bacterium]|nr:exodeoxyribonuclease V subunit alpha [Magnetococcales bacterium]NGZ05864.1 exodeoxyribonuclease V subunit alpha [Magnetococcales bacterium]
MTRSAKTDSCALLSAGEWPSFLDRWLERGWLRPVDLAMAWLCRQRMPEISPLVLVAATLVSHQAGQGHVWLDLAGMVADPSGVLGLPPEGEEASACPPEDLPANCLKGVDCAQWLAVLAVPGLVERATVDPASTTPLVLHGHHLYLRRFWVCEQEVWADLRHRLACVAAVPDPVQVRELLDALLPERTPRGPMADWQRMACALMLRTHFGVITGGPGTGKTTTVVRLLALLHRFAVGAQPDRPLRIALAAPTGKAAARLSESIRDELERMHASGKVGDPLLLQAIPRQVTTLHRLLGGQYYSRHFRHGPDLPLPLDVLIVDEASMLGLELMADLLRALPKTARLYLLGDKDQLASVEAGAVLGSLSARATRGHYTPATCDWLAATTGHRIEEPLIDPMGTALDQAVLMLRRNFRFSSDSGIGQLAAAIRDGQVAKAAEWLARPCVDLEWMAIQEDPDAWERRLVADTEGRSIVKATEQNLEWLTRQFGYRAYLEQMHVARPGLGADMQEVDAWAAAVLRARGGFQVLCALRQGPWGVEGLNERIARRLVAAGLLSSWQGWYPGRPVLVTRNDYALGLMNGDIGIALEIPTTTGAWVLRVAFPDRNSGEDRVRWLAPSRLAAVETVFALTVHKSQGSEFSQVMLVLPDTSNPLLTRELIYTGLTRARNRFVLAGAGAKSLLFDAIERRVQRAGQDGVQP